MRTLKICAFIFLMSLCGLARAQEMPAAVTDALKADDAAKFAAAVGKDHVNDCYQENGWDYSLLSQTVRFNARKCFDWLIAGGADVNKSCNGYVPPLMHAAKYGQLEMVKVLVAKGADVNYTYHGDYQPAEGQSPITYAEQFKHTEIADYLRSVKK